MIDLQMLANVATSVAVIIALCVFLWQVSTDRKERAFSTFLKLLDYYGGLRNDRRTKWNLLKERVRSDPKISHEIGDKTSSLDYLLLRVKQEEPLYALEHGVLEDEIRSLNLLNQLCRYALKDEQMSLVLKVLYSSEISYYQNRLDDLLLIRDTEKRFRLFSTPRFGYLQKLQVADYFGLLSQDGVS